MKKLLDIRCISPFMFLACCGIGLADATNQPAFVLRVDCAANEDYQDPRGNTWKADQPFKEGGWGYEGGESTDRGPRMTIANTGMKRLYQTERYGLQSYRITVPEPGRYTVCLHFAETFVYGEDQRVFGIAINGKLVFPKIDVFAEAGFASAFVKITEVDVKDSELAIDFIADTQSPMINALEVVSGAGEEVRKLAGSYDPYRQSSPARVSSGPFVLRINCGSTEDYRDPRRNVWRADRLYQKDANTWGAEGGSTVNRGEDVQILKTDMPQLFRTERYRLSGYRIPVPQNGKYTVALYFAETFDGIVEPDERLFNVVVEGRKELQRFGPLKDAGGTFTALVKLVDADVRDGELNIEFDPIVQSPMINAIAVVQGSGTEAAAALNAGIGDDVKPDDSVPAACNMTGVPWVLFGGDRFEIPGGPGHGMHADFTEWERRFAIRDLYHQLVFLKVLIELDLSPGKQKELLDILRDTRQVMHARTVEMLGVLDNQVLTLVDMKDDLMGIQRFDVKHPQRGVYDPGDWNAFKKPMSELGKRFMAMLAEDQMKLVSNDKSALGKILKELNFIPMQRQYIVNPLHLQWSGPCYRGLTQVENLLLAPGAVEILEKRLGEKSGNDAAWVKEIVKSVKKLPSWHYARAAQWIFDGKLESDPDPENPHRLIDIVIARKNHELQWWHHHIIAECHLLGGLNLNNGQLEKLVSLAEKAQPLHNEHNAACIENAGAVIPSLRQIRDLAMDGKHTAPELRVRLSALQKQMCPGYEISCRIHKTFSDELRNLTPDVEDVLLETQAGVLYGWRPCLHPYQGSGGPNENPIRVGEVHIPPPLPEQAEIEAMRCMSNDDYAVKRDAMVLRRLNEIKQGQGGKFTQEKEEAERKRLGGILDSARNISDAEFLTSAQEIAAQFSGKTPPGDFREYVYPGGKNPRWIANFVAKTKEEDLVFAFLGADLEPFLKEWLEAKKARESLPRKPVNLDSVEPAVAEESDAGAKSPGNQPQAH